MSLLLAALTAAVYGTADFLGGMAGRRAATPVVVGWSQLVGLGAVTLAAPLAGGSPRPVDLAWGVAAGLAGNLGLVALYHGLAVGRAAVVAPVSAVVGTTLPVGLGLALGEQPGPAAWAGMALAVPALVAVAAGTEEGSATRGGLRLGLAAGVGFGLFFAFIAQTPDEAGLWPLIGARAATVAVIVAVLVARRLPARPPAGTWPLLVGVGIGDILANVMYLVAVRAGPITLVTVLASLYPGVTVLLARVVQHQPLERRQVAGLVLALTAVGLLVAG